MANAAVPVSRGKIAATRHLNFESASFQAQFNREPMGFSHDLSSLPMFSDAALRSLAAIYDAHPRDYYVAASAPTAGTEFFSVPRASAKPTEAMDRLDGGAIRILLKRPEDHDAGFRRLRDELFAEVLALRGGLRGERLVRLESSVFITSAASTTPFHFDPEIAFFFQIEGDKSYHVYPPVSLREPELEKFYLRGQVSIGQVDLGARDCALERVFELRAGLGFHQPQDSPHWVQTRASRSVSYSFVYETDVGRARGRARACNYYLRKFGIEPISPGQRPALDALKAGTMRMVIPVRRRVGAGLRSLLRK
jgi:hypothetical protein